MTLNNVLPSPQPGEPITVDASQNIRTLVRDVLRQYIRIHDNGTVYARGAKFQVSRTLAGQIVYRVEEDDRLVIFDSIGTRLIKYPWPKPGTKYVGNGKARGARGPRSIR